jgi:hypothetical protein
MDTEKKIVNSKTIRMVLTDSIFLLFAYISYINGEYEWFFKCVMYIIISLGIISYVGILSKKSLLLEKECLDTVISRKSNFYMVIDIIFDLIFISVFVFLQYKLLFVMYIIHFLLSLGVYFEIRKN